MRSDVLLGKPKSGCANPSGIGSEDHNDVQGADRVEPLVRDRVVADRGGPRAPMFVHAEEDVDACSN